jgi:hypothetical protein
MKFTYEAKARMTMITELMRKLRIIFFLRDIGLYYRLWRRKRGGVMPVRGRQGHGGFSAEGLSDAGPRSSLPVKEENPGLCNF